MTSNGTLKKFYLRSCKGMFRFEENVYKSGGDESGEESDDDSIKGRKRGERKSERKKRNEDDEYRPDELAFNKSEYFRVCFISYLHLFFKDLSY